MLNYRLGSNHDAGGAVWSCDELNALRFEYLLYRNQSLNVNRWNPMSTFNLYDCLP